MSIMFATLKSAVVKTLLYNYVNKE